MSEVRRLFVLLCGYEVLPKSASTRGSGGRFILAEPICAYLLDTVRGWVLLDTGIDPAYARDPVLRDRFFVSRGWTPPLVLEDHELERQLEASGVGFGVTLIGPAGSDRALVEAATTLFPAPASPPPLDLEGRMDTVKLAVVGAHLKDMPLHWQLTSRDARFVGEATTAPTYRLYAIADSVPPKPALVHDEGGAAIALEVYELDMAAFGSFVADVPPPLAIGTVTLADGSLVKGFVAEPRAVTNAEDITALGGWRAYIGRK